VKKKEGIMCGYIYRKPKAQMLRQSSSMNRELKTRERVARMDRMCERWM